MKTYAGEGITVPFLSSVNNQLGASAALPPTKRLFTRLGWIEDSMLPRANVKAVDHKKIFPLTGIKPRSSGRRAMSELFRLNLLHIFKS
jgi:hypothetical protein